MPSSCTPEKADMMLVEHRCLEVWTLAEGSCIATVIRDLGSELLLAAWVLVLLISARRGIQKGCRARPQALAPAWMHPSAASRVLMARLAASVAASCRLLLLPVSESPASLSDDDSPAASEGKVSLASE